MIHNKRIVEEYLSYLSHIRRLSKHTIISYGHHLEQFITFLDEREVNIGEVDSLLARKFISTLIVKKLEKATVNSYLASIKSLYHYLMKMKKVTHNPFSLLQSNPRVRKLPSYLTLEEVHRLLSYQATDPITLRDITLFHLFYATGCRMSEILGMNYRDVNEKEARIKVVGKGNKTRFVFLTPKATSLLLKLKEGRDTWFSLYPLKEKRDGDAIFLSVGGKRLSPSTLHSIFDKYRIKLGLHTKFTPHMLRHSFATHLINNESPIQLVSELLGHASLSTTQIYTHITTDRLKEVYTNSHPHGRNKDGNTRNDNHSGEERQ